MILGLIIAIGPLSIDMYLPALPSMAQDFGVATAFMSNSVPAYFVGLVVGQLFYGPISDRIGRIKPLYVGMVLYVINLNKKAGKNHKSATINKFY